MKNSERPTVETLINLNNEYPRGSRVITTLFNRPIDYDTIMTDDILDDEQYVIAIGQFVTGLEVGDKVRIDLEKLVVVMNDTNGERFEKLKVDPIMVGETTCGLLNESVIKTVIK